jgi:hypothetical protein
MTTALLPFAVIGDHGRVKYSGTSNARPPASEGLVLEQLAPAGTWWNDSEFVPIGAAPSMLHRFDWPTHTWVDQKTLDVAKALKRAEVDREFCARASRLTDGYPEPERLTWPVQQAEALAFAADPQAATPYLDGLAAARGIAPADMRQRTLEAVQAFMQASQMLVGTRQKIQTQVDTAESITALDAIAWPG